MEPVLCPGCGEAIPEDRLVPGARFGCANCAALLLEVVSRDGGGVGLREVLFASCPVCDTPLEVPGSARPGSTIDHCGRRLRLTHEFDAWALEPVEVTL